MANSINAQAIIKNTNATSLKLYYKNISAGPFYSRNNLLSKPSGNAYSIAKLHKQFSKSANANPNCLDSSFKNKYYIKKLGIFTDYVMMAKNGDILVSGAATNDTITRRNYYGYLIRLNSNGDVIWMKEYYNNQIASFDFYKLYETDNNEIIAVGDWYYKNNPNNDSSYSTVVAKLTENGDITWLTAFNSKLEKGYSGCKGQSSVFINSISSGMNGDLIFSGTTWGCPSPMYNTVFLMDNSGNIKWDANFTSDVTLPQGIGAVLYKGNILSAAKQDNIFSGGDNTINIFFQTLDYNTGKTINLKAFKADYAFPDCFYKAFGSWSVQMIEGFNGHYYIYGNMENAYGPDLIHNEVFGVVEFDNDLSFVNGYTINTNVLSSDGQSSYFSSSIRLDNSGNAAFTWIRFPDYTDQEIYFANLKNGNITNSKQVFESNVSTYGNGELSLNPDNSTIYTFNYQVRVSDNYYQNYLVFRKNYESDTSQSDCLGIDTSFAFTGSLKYIEYPQFYIADSSFNKLYYLPHDIKILQNENLIYENSCAAASACDTIKIHGKLSFCGTNPEATFTAYKNSDCGAAVLWNIDTSAVSNISYPNDTTIDIRFNKDWDGKLFAQISGGSCSLPLNDSVVIHVQSSSKILNLGSDTILCLNDSLILNAGSSYNNFLWQDGSTDSFYIVKSPGQYSVSVTDFCNNTYKDTINVIAAPKYNFSIGEDTAICTGDIISLTASPRFKNYTWYIDSVFSGANQRISTVIYQNEYISNVAMTNENCHVSDSVFVTALALEKINLGNDTSFCSYDSLILHAGNAYNSYDWNTGNHDSLITVKQPGIYFVVAKDKNGCIISDTIEIKNVFPKPVPYLGADRDICNGSIIVLDAGKYQTYNWQDGSSGEYFNASQTGNYWVQVTDQNSCIGSDSFIIQNTLQPPSDFLNPVDSLCEYDKLTLSPLGSYRDYLWSTGETMPSVTIDKMGLYFLNVTDIKGCKGSDTIKVVNKECMHGVYIPTAFTPNNDGLNDIFKARVFGKVVYFKLSIYDRFGELIFNSNDPAKGWNGLIKGQPQNTGTYIWQCSYQLDGDKMIWQKGTILLMH